MFSMPGGSEWLVIFLIVMVVFGGKKIPEMMEGLGKGIRTFKSALNEPEALAEVPVDRRPAEAKVEKHT